jgi:hypothetical protein
MSEIHRYLDLHYIPKVKISETAPLHMVDKMNPLRLIYIITIPLFFINASLWGKEQIQIDRYLFIFPESEKTLTQELIHSLKPGLSRVHRFFNRQNKEIITIYITKSQSQFQQFIKNQVPKWSQAVAFPLQKLIVLKLNTPQAIQQAPKTLLHELSHIHLYEATNMRNVPVWFNEGLAEYLGYERLELSDKIILANAISAKRIIALDDLETLLGFDYSKAKLAYIEARSAIDFFVSQYGELQLEQLVSTLRYVSFEIAFKTVTSKEFIDFEVDWYENIYEKYRFLIILNFENFLWIIMLILLGLAVFIKKRYKRKKMVEWDKEDILEPNTTHQDIAP